MFSAFNCLLFIALLVAAQHCLCLGFAQVLGYEAYLAGTEYMVAVGESCGCQGFGKGLAVVDPAAYYLPCTFGVVGGDVEHAEFALAVGANDEPFCLFCLLHDRNYLISSI